MRRSLTMVVSVVLILGACGGDDTDPAATVESYIEAYNAGDLGLVMTHFTQDSVITGHPTGLSSVTNGLAAIRRLHTQDLSFDVGYVISNVETSGDTVTWDSVWGDDGCVQGQSTVVEDGKMVTWTWGEFVDCP